MVHGLRTPYGKILQVKVRGDSLLIRFRYDAAGNREEKQVVLEDSTYATRYVRDGSGNVMAIYKDSSLIEQPLYGSSRLGEFKGGEAVGARTLGNKSYELSNHLGNVLAVISDKVGMQGDSVWAKVVSTYDYYPFGLAMKGRTWSDTTGYRYGFNGKEKDTEGLGGGGSTYDYGFRIYNPRISKFLSVDPLTQKYLELTPYQFAGNMPIKFIDLDGLEPAELGSEKGEYQVANRQGTNQEFGYTWTVGEKGNGSWTEGEKLTPYVNGATTRKEAEDSNTEEGDLAAGDTPRPHPFKLNIFDSNQDLERNMQGGIAAGTSWTDFTAGRQLFNHFVSGNGDDFTFPNGSSISNEIRNDPRFIAYARRFEDHALEYFRAKGNLNDFKGNDFLLRRPGFRGIANNLFLATAVGGTQGVRAEIRLVNCREIRVNYSVYDIFGTGRNDAGRWDIPGLQSMYELQHYRNARTDSRNLYQPFFLGINFYRHTTPN